MRTEYEIVEREARVVAWVPSDLNANDIEKGSNRLRSWALIIGVPIAGDPFVVLRGAESARVCLPLAEWHPAHPETGVTVERTPAGPVACFTGVPLSETIEAARSAVRETGGASAVRGDVEFHPDGRGSLSGLLEVPLKAGVKSNRHAAMAV